MNERLPARLSTGVAGLDAILGGGVIRDRCYMLHGPAGSGKTILGFHFLQHGLEAGETVLFINLEEDIADLTANAAALGFDVDSIEFLDASPTAAMFTENETYDVFDAADVEQESLVDRIVDAVHEHEPDRVVIDPLTQFRYLTSDDYQFRKQSVGLMRFLTDQGATVFFTTQETDSLPTDELQYISDGTITLERTDTGRRVSVPKFRGSSTQTGDHTAKVTDRGLVVYPELRAGQRDADFEPEPISSGVPELDELLDGGFERGTVSVLSGPTGVGKTTLGTQFMKEAAGRGDRSIIYLFEETKDTFIHRSEAVNIPVEAMIDRGTLRVEEVEGLEYSPQEFAQRVRREVETNGTDIVMLDGISGYQLTLSGSGDELLTHLHRLGRYLKTNGVTTILVDETASVTGDFTATQENISYLADNIVFLRHLELGGELEKAIGVLKKRTSDFERTLRSFEITAHGIKVGEPLTGLRGILDGMPERADDSP